MSRSTFGVSVIPFIRFVFSCFISIRSGLGTEISFGGKATITIPGVFGSFCFIWDFLVSLFQFFSLSFFFVVFFGKAECKSWMDGCGCGCGWVKGDKRGGGRGEEPLDCKDT